MKNNMRNSLALIGLGLGLFLPLKTALADENVASGFKQYAAEWEQWAWTIPTAVSPLLDTTGANCMIAQRGPVWFLAGFADIADLGKVTRSCDIPEGKWLFFPIANTIWFDTPGVCGSNSVPTSIKDLRKGAADTIDGIKKTSALIDGKPVKYLKRVQSEVFDITFPEDNLFDIYCGDSGNFPAGVYSPAVDDGYYPKKIS